MVSGEGGICLSHGDCPMSRKGFGGLHRPPSSPKGGLFLPLSVEGSGISDHHLTIRACSSPPR